MPGISSVTPADLRKLLRRTRMIKVSPIRTRTHGCQPHAAIPRSRGRVQESASSRGPTRGSAQDVHARPEAQSERKVASGAKDEDQRSARSVRTRADQEKGRRFLQDSETRRRPIRIAGATQLGQESLALSAYPSHSGSGAVSIHDA